MTLTPLEIIRLLTLRGQHQYGREAVTQLDHALQCAHLAEQAGESNETVIAALLHDLGHLLSTRTGDRDDEIQAHDDRHEYIALPYLKGLLPQAVLEPIRLHVDAKRYLCATQPGYWHKLSPASQRSLELQGGAYSGAQACEFIKSPYADVAVRLRQYDDLAKIPEQSTPPLSHFHHILQRISSTT